MRSQESSVQALVSDEQGESRALRAHSLKVLSAPSISRRGLPTFPLWFTRSGRALPPSSWWLS